jgi:hypothetical protein
MQRLLQLAPEWCHAPLLWLVEPRTLGVLTAVSLVLFVLSVVGVPWFVARMPTDYFSRRELAELGVEPQKRRISQVVWLVAKNALGLFLFGAGVLMLIFPGQGLITMAVALILLDFPGKKRLERRILCSRPILRSINALRRRAGRPPLERGPSFG